MDQSQWFKSTMRIGELSRRVGVSRDAIRLYERRGLIQSQEGDAETNNYRIYPEDAVLTLELIRDAQAAGVTLADLSILIGQLAAVDGDDFDGDAFLAGKIAEVEARITQSQRFLETLKTTRQALEDAPKDAS